MGAALVRADGGRARRIEQRWGRPLAFGLTVAGLIAVLVIAWVKASDGFAWDARAYYLADYATGYTTDQYAYLYSPAFAQALAPLRMLPWAVFLPIWTFIQALAFVATAGPFTLPLLLWEPVWFELDVANVTFLLGLAIVAGFRYPWTWSLVLLTKVTPGVGLLWFAFRREWRSLGIALGATAVISAVSFAVAPGEWFAWASVLLVHDPYPGFGPPLAIRLPVAVVLIWWGARTDRRWVVPIAAMLALPVLRTTGLVLLVACPPLVFLDVRRLRELIEATRGQKTITAWNIAPTPPAPVSPLRGGARAQRMAACPRRIALDSIPKRMGRRSAPTAATPRRWQQDDLDDDPRDPG